MRRTFVRRAVHAWGLGDSGQLGLPAALLAEEVETYGRGALTPQRVPGLGILRCAAASAAHSAFVDKNGALLFCGLGDDGQLGNGGHGVEGGVASVSVGVGDDGVEGVACGGRHSLVLKDGVVWSAGGNRRGQLGFGDRHDVAHFRAVRMLKDVGVRVVGVAAGEDFSVAVADGGEVFSWGGAGQGRLGHGSAERAPGVARFILGEAWVCETSPRLIRGLVGRKVVRVQCGKHHTVAIDDCGRAIAWGAGRHFQLGTGDERDHYEPVDAFSTLRGERIVKVAPGGMHSLILCESGRVYALGANEAGCLGLGYAHGGTGAVDTPELVPGLRNATDVAAGWGLSAAVVDGTVFTWGSGNAGAIGTGDPVDHWAPVDTGIKAGKVVIGCAGSHVIAYD